MKYSSKCLSYYSLGKFTYSQSFWFHIVLTKISTSITKYTVNNYFSFITGTRVVEVNSEVAIQSFPLRILTFLEVQRVSLSIDEHLNFNRRNQPGYYYALVIIGARLIEVFFKVFILLFTRKIHIFSVILVSHSLD